MANENKQSEASKSVDVPFVNKDIEEMKGQLNTLMGIVGNPTIQGLMTPQGQEGIQGAVIFGLKAQNKSEEADQFLGRKPPEGIIQKAGRFVTHQLEKPQTGADLLIKGAGLTVGVVAYDYAAAKLNWTTPRPGWFEAKEDEGMAPPSKSKR